MSDESTVDPHLYRLAFLACPSLVFLTTRRATILDATAAAAAFLNVPVGFLEGKPLLHFVPRKDTGPFRSFVERGAWEPLSVKLRPRHGTPRAVRMTVQPASGRLIWLAELQPAPQCMVPPVAEESCEARAHPAMAAGSSEQTEASGT